TKALNIAVNAKTHRYGTCNTMETLLVHQDVANELLPALGEAYTALDVELRGCDRSRDILHGITAATAADWDTEYLAPILSIKIV
ncbi:gamma-glutamyl-phosphate reductase, partial [Wenyingzhuangia sp. 1_MG-2023]|nr:gamma-glutamyl-phosphate reductase [Wenyingzhuangia sp. 1_MG-2023]